jgi:uncharacterized protein YjbJ (UPF0337 family)
MLRLPFERFIPVELAFQGRHSALLARRDYMGRAAKILQSSFGVSKRALGQALERKEIIMALDDVFEGRWKQVKGDAKRLWGNLTDDDLDRSEGHKDKLVGALQERYGWEKVRAESEFDRFVDSVRTPAGTRTDR